MIGSYDILVVGGGPAGCVAARGLAALGYRVGLVTAERRPAIEGLSERVIQAIRDLGFLRVDEVLGPVVRREANWQGLKSSANREWLVDRRRFDAAFRSETVAAGVELTAARVGKIQPHGENWSVSARDGRRWQAPYLIDARGRAGGGRRLRGPSTTALSRYYRDLEPKAFSAIASARHGWAWFASMGDGTGTLQLAFASPLPKRAALSDMWDRSASELAEARRWLGKGDPFGPIAVRHAEASRALEVIGDGLIRIGDAALAMDPLSGHGVFEAVASAAAAVPVAHTLLARSGDGDLAARFYRQRIDHGFMRLARIGRDFYALEERYRDERFWLERRIWPDYEPAHGSPDDSDDLPVIASKPVIEDGFITERRVIVTADQPRGVWQVDRVPIAGLLERLQDGAPVDPITLAETLKRRPEQIETALAWLRFRGLIDGDP